MNPINLQSVNSLVSAGKSADAPQAGKNKPPHDATGKKAGDLPRIPITYLDPMDVERFWKNVDSNHSKYECWPWKGYRNANNYGVLRINGRHLQATRLCFFIHRGAFDVRLDVMHSCDNPPCCNPHHLSLGTARNNMADCVTKGRIATGERHGSQTHPECVLRGQLQPRSKISDADAIEIRRLASGGMKQKEIGKRFGIKQQAVSYIVLRRGWRHLP